MESSPLIKSKFSSPFYLILSLIVLVIFSICIGLLGLFVGKGLKMSSEGVSVNLTDISAQCANNGGVWVNKSNECEKISEPVCKMLGGEFDACASPCRNAGGQVMCIQMCVQVCKFK